MNPCKVREVGSIPAVSTIFDDMDNTHLLTELKSLHQRFYNTFSYFFLDEHKWEYYKKCKTLIENFKGNKKVLIIRQNVKIGEIVGIQRFDLTWEYCIIKIKNNRTENILQVNASLVFPFTNDFKKYNNILRPKTDIQIISDQILKLEEKNKSFKETIIRNKKEIKFLTKYLR